MFQPELGFNKTAYKRRFSVGVVVLKMPLARGNEAGNFDHFSCLSTT